jgi:hypothetical protein
MGGWLIRACIHPRNPLGAGYRKGSAFIVKGECGAHFSMKLVVASTESSANWIPTTTSPIVAWCWRTTRPVR